MRRFWIVFVQVCVFSVLIGCQDDLGPEVTDPIINDVDPDINDNNPPGNNNNIFSALPANTPDRAGNPSTFEKVELGRNLFFDPILSGNMDVACATCHHPDQGYADGLDLSIGVGGVGLGTDRRVGLLGFAGRNSPTILNTAFNGIGPNGNVNPATAPMFWDNSTQGLEAQSLLPMHSFVEMRGNAYTEDETMDVIIDRLQNIAAYRNQFQAVFGNTGISAQNISQAIAVFERSILANNSPFDDYMRGNLNALSEQQLNGMQDFIRVGCVNCHVGPMLSDYDLHVLGVRENNKLDEVDRGNGNFAFRTPTLRNLAFTAPYMHNGEFNSLRQVLNFYDNNNNNSQNPNVNNNQLDQDLRQLNNLNQNQINNIIEFLESLNDPSFDRTIPASVPSNLNPGGTI